MKKKSNLAMILIIALIAVIAASFIYLFSGNVVDYFTGKVQQSVILPEATGNVNDLVEALTREIHDEDLLLKEEEGDLEIMVSDSKEISDFDQSINEN